MVSCTPRIEYAPRLLGPSHLIQAGVDTILPEGHIPRGWFGSATSTTPPSFRFFLFSLHFFLSLTLGICSLVKRFQKKYWQALETVAIISLGWSLSLLPTSVSSLLEFARRSRKWFGVSASISPASFETCVIRGDCLVHHLLWPELF